MKYHFVVQYINIAQILRTSAIWRQHNDDVFSHVTKILSRHKRRRQKFIRVTSDWNKVSVQILIKLPLHLVDINIRLWKEALSHPGHGPSLVERSSVSPNFSVSKCLLCCVIVVRTRTVVYLLHMLVACNLEYIPQCSVQNENRMIGWHSDHMVEYNCRHIYQLGILLKIVKIL